MATPRACAFCRREALRASNRLVYEVRAAKWGAEEASSTDCGSMLEQDALVAAIEDRHPRAAVHLLVIPHQHISTVDDLTHEHLDLLRHMMDTGERILEDRGYARRKADSRFGFHRPPFASIHHLHMHCLGEPFTPIWNRLRYTESFLRSYISVESVLAKLEQNARACE